MKDATQERLAYYQWVIMAVVLTYILFAMVACKTADELPPDWDVEDESGEPIELRDTTTEAYRLAKLTRKTK